jgi:hypothetical protein
MKKTIIVCASFFALIIGAMLLIPSCKKERKTVCGSPENRVSRNQRIIINKSTVQGRFYSGGTGKPDLSWFETTETTVDNTLSS